MDVGTVTIIQEENVQSCTDYDLIDNFIQDCNLRGYSSETIRSHRSNLRIIRRFLEENGITFSSLDKEGLKLLLDYLKNCRKVGVKTQQSYFSALSSFFDYLVFEEIVSVNPVPSFRKRYLTTYKKNISIRQRKLISIEEMSLLINSVLNTRDKLIMTILAKRARNYL